MDKRAKVVVVGMGGVGSACAFSLLLHNVPREMVLIDVNKDKAKGEAMDLNHAVSLLHPTEIYDGEYEDCKDADIIVITAGIKQKPGQTRLDLLNTNSKLMKGIIQGIMPYLAPHAILLIVSNPVDILTYLALKMSKLPANRVIGSGTLLDSSRIKFVLGEYLSINPGSIQSYVIGEHGDSEVAAWSLSRIGGVPVQQLIQQKDPSNYKKRLEQFHQQVRDAAGEIIKAKGATAYGIAVSVTRIVEAILRDENSVLPISSLIEDHLGVKDVCLSLPSVVGQQGVKKILPVKLADEELNQFKKSADLIKEMISKIEF